jgi:hypothetical protein
MSNFEWEPLPPTAEQQTVALRYRILMFLEKEVYGDNRCSIDESSPIWRDRAKFIEVARCLAPNLPEPQEDIRVGALITLIIQNENHIRTDNQRLARFYQLMDIRDRDRNLFAVEMALEVSRVFSEGEALKATGKSTIAIGNLITDYRNAIR